MQRNITINLYHNYNVKNIIVWMAMVSYEMGMIRMARPGVSKSGDMLAVRVR